MKVAKAREIEAALDRPSPDIRLYVLHGPDAATAAALAQRLSRAMGDGAERVDLEGATLRGDPARLADEAAALSLFGDARWIRVANGGEESADAVAALLGAERAGNPVVLLAPTAKATGKLVKAAVEARNAMAFACYEPSAADAEKLVAALARDAGLRVQGSVAGRIAAAAGNDRAVIAREIEKLALYLDASPDRPHDLDQDAIDAVGADLGEAETSAAVAGVIDGHASELGAELARLTDQGASPIPWLRQLARRLVALAEMRGEVDAGRGMDDVLRRHRVFWKEEPATRGALQRWTPAMLATALDRVRQAERAVMASGNPGPVVADHRMLDLARSVERRG